VEVPTEPKQRKTPLLVDWWLGLRENAYDFVPKGVTVLDIGCGMGESLLELRRKKCIAYGVDADKNFQKSIDQNKLNGKVGFFNSKDYPAAFFDYVILDQLIEHVENPIDFLLDVKKVLKSNGKLIIATPNFEGFNIKLFKKKSFMWHVPYHLHFFNKKTISKLAKTTGFTVEKNFTKTNSEWLFYQLAHLFNYPKRGKKSPFFYPWQGIRKLDNTIVISIIFLFHLLGINHTILRLMDAIGYGDNSIYIFNKNE